ncbi:MAG: tetratricopeptide repeat protein [Candidatus Aminicenantes bacterium]|nr:tetratricopeptide repeat protein [Candidatus Aminicenantes bacterium]
MERKNLKLFIHFGLVLFLLFSALQASEQNLYTKIRSFEELEKAIAQAKEEVQAKPEDVDAHFRLGRLLFMDGKYLDAEKSLAHAVKLNNRHIPSMVALSDLLRRSYQFDKGKKILKTILKFAPENEKAKFLEAKFKVDSMDFESARKIYQNILKEKPTSVDALCGLAQISYWLNEYEEAEEFIQKCMDLYPEFTQAYVIQSRIHRIRQENDKWNKLGRKAVELDPFDDDARANLANILYRGEGKLQEGYEQAKIALRINPYSPIARFYLGNGWTPHFYEEQKIEGAPETVKKIKELLKEGDSYLLEREFKKADQAFGKVLELMPTNITAMIGKGTGNYHKKNYDEALYWFFQVLDINPDYGLAHYGVCQILLRIKDKINVRFDENEKAFASKDSLEPPHMKNVFINYEQLNRDMQKILRLSVQPLKNYLKALRIAGATFYLTPFHKLLWEAPYNEGLKDQRTFDLRLWDDVKGNGGFHATSGEDWERDVKYLRFNVVAHEFAHQVHPFLSKKHREEIKWLFLKAKKERRTLDFYADFNEWEYFAVGVEAFVSLEKLADQKIGYGHTQRELLETDPDLYYFIESLGNLYSYEESEILAVVRKAMSVLRKESKEKTMGFLGESIKAYGDHPEFHEAMANVYKFHKEHDKAKEIYLEAVNKFPNDSRGYIGLADTYFYIDQEREKAILFLEDSLEKYPNAVDQLVKLGELYYYAADVDKGAEVFQKALSIDPFPDPYSPSDPYYYLAKSFAEKEEFAKAEKLLDFSLAELDKNNLRVRAERAFVAFKTGKADEGQEHLELALKLRGRDPRVKEIEALFLQDQGKRKEARKLLEELMKQHPNRLETKIQVASLIMDSEPEKAREILREAMGIVYPKEEEQPEVEKPPAPQIADQILVSRLHTAYGMLEEKTGETKEAVNHHQKAWDLFKYNYTSAVALVKLYKQTGMEEAASEIYKKLKEIDAPATYLKKCEEILGH